MISFLPTSSRFALSPRVQPAQPRGGMARVGERAIQAAAGLGEHPRVRDARDTQPHGKSNEEGTKRRNENNLPFSKGREPAEPSIPHLTPLREKALKIISSSSIPISISSRRRHSGHGSSQDSVLPQYLFSGGFSHPSSRN